jgi:hypothetical protein
MGSNIRVECFAAESDIDLEDEINKWISDNNVEIIDIKFSSSMCVDETRIYYDYGALIIYKMN